MGSELIAAPSIRLFIHDLDRDDTPDARIDAWLSADELQRAVRFATPLLQRRYRLGRALARVSLEVSAGIPARGVPFSYGRWGKPTLAGAPPFNLAHSDSLLVIAVADRGQVGVDVERLRAIEDAEELARHYFARREVSELISLHGAERDHGFLRIWTRKEALLKCAGRGLSIPLDAFVVTAADTPGNALLHAEPRLGWGAQWSVAGMTIDGAAAAVAADAPSCRVAIGPHGELQGAL